MAAQPKRPQDHLPKVARTTSVTIVLDDEKADIYDRAQAAFLTKAQELTRSFSQRVTKAVAEAGSVLDEETAKAKAKEIADQDQAELAVFEQAVQVAEGELDKVRQVFQFRALGRKAWRALLAKHPATDEDNESWKAEGGEGPAPYNIEGLSVELIRVAMISPVLSKAALDEIFDGDQWSEAEISLLFQYALLAQNQARPDPKSKQRR